MRFEIRPHSGIGPVTFGMPREVTRTLLIQLGGGNPVLRSKKTDCYFKNCFQISFEDDSVSYIELMSDRGIDLIFEGKDVFDTPADALVSHISQFDLPDPLLSDKCSYVFSILILTLWDADSQYDHKGGELRDIFGAVGIGDQRYLAAIRAIRERRRQ